MSTATIGNGFDTQRSERFSQRMLEMLNGASVVMMVSLGHRTGLLDAMGRLREPATVAEIARESGLQERYVREWLGAMVTGQVVEYDPATRRYNLPAEHAAWLTRAASPNNLAVTATFVPVLASVEPHVAECFFRGGGVPYEKFHGFHEAMAEESAQTVCAALCEHILPLAPGLVDRLKQGIDVLDVGCGSGRALCLMGQTFPASRFTGYDFCGPAIESARRHAQGTNLANVRFDVRDVTHIDQPRSYDLVTAFDAIHDQPHPAQVLQQIHQALRPGGVFLMQDIRASSHVHQNVDHPLGPFLYTISTMHCMTVSLAHHGSGLGTCWGEELALKMLGEAGFKDVQVRTLPHDIQNNFYIMTR